MICAKGSGSQIGREAQSTAAILDRWMIQSAPC